jgi:hypothetical protein
MVPNTTASKCPAPVLRKNNGSLNALYSATAKVLWWPAIGSKRPILTISQTLCGASYPWETSPIKICGNCWAGKFEVAKEAFMDNPNVKSAIRDALSRDMHIDRQPAALYLSGYALANSQIVP